jgi:hypothetical protein
MPRNTFHYIHTRQTLALALLLGLLSLPVLPNSVLNLLQPTASAAITLTVNSTGDGGDSNVFDGVCNDGTGACTLRAAIQQSNVAGADTIDFRVPAGSKIRLTGGELLLSRSLSIAGPGASLVAVSGNNASRVFRVFSGATVIISGLTVTEGRATGGGGIFNQGGTLTINNCIISNNDATPGVGGGIANGSGGDQSGTLRVNNSTISNNRAVSGGGLHQFAGAFLTNTTISNNSSDGQGGGITNLNPATLNNVTVTGNTAMGTGGGIYNPGIGVITIKDTLIAGNTATAVSSAPDCDGFNYNSLDYNLIGNTAGCNVVGVTTHNKTNVAPGLGPLADNGGPTPTHALLAGSPAIDAANSTLPIDQRIGNRPVDDPSVANASAGNASDIGAYELGATPANQAPYNSLPPDQSTDEDTNLVFSAANSNQISIADADAGAGQLQVSLTVSSGSLALNNGMSGSAVNLAGTVAEINSALSTTVFSPNPESSGTVTLNITTNDNGNTGTGGALGDSDALTITVRAINDAPVNTVPGAQSLVENGSLVFSSGNGNALSVSDIDVGAGNLQVTLAVSNGTMTLGSTAGLTFTTGDGANDASMTFNGTPASINAALNGLLYAPQTGFSGQVTLQITTNDLGNTGAGGAQSDSDVVNITVEEGGTLQFSASAYGVDEDAGTATITVTRTGGSAGATTVNFATSDATATSGSDYTPTSGTLSFAHGETASKSFTIPILDDLAHEADEQVNLTLSVVTGSGSLGTPQTAVLTISDDDPVGGRLQFEAATYHVDEALTSVTITVKRVGDTSQAVTVDYATADLTASQRSDYTAALGTLKFAAGETSKTFIVLVNEDAHGEGTEAFSVALSNATGDSLIDTPDTTTVEINDDVPESQSNPIDDAEAFVRQHYHDFLNREPDAAGLAFWTAQITECETRPASERQGCREVRRINVSAAFFLSIEFQETGFFVHKAYAASYGNMPNTPVPLTLREFLRDTQEISRGVIIGQPGAEALLEQNKTAYFNSFVQTPRFVALYPESMSPEAFVDALNQNTGGSLTQAERDALVAQLQSGARTRAQVLRSVVENAEFTRRERNEAFVLMQYFGYLRRNPNDAPEPGLNFDGYNFWLTKLNSFGGNFITAEMVKAFITSGEYRQRFGQ